MYVILFYDINEKRVNKVLKICRKYLMRVQNSVFEGQLTERKLEDLKREIAKVVNFKQDSVCIYKFGSLKFIAKDEIGVLRGDNRFI